MGTNCCQNLWIRENPINLLHHNIQILIISPLLGCKVRHIKRNFLCQNSVLLRKIENLYFKCRELFQTGWLLQKTPVCLPVQNYLVRTVAAVAFQNL